MQDIIIIGGGASGMTAAIMAARAGAKVTILEQNDMLGKKILSTGNGRCNLTNRKLEPENYRGDDPQFAGKVLEAFGLQDVLDFFTELGIYTKCRGDYVYPLCDQAAAVREAFVMELDHLGVRTVTGCHVEEIVRKKEGFQIFCGKKQPAFWCSRVILAAGSKASQVSGSDGSGYGLAKMLGHSLSPVVPALVQLRAEEAFFKKLAGIRVTASVSLSIDGHIIARDTGELQLTDYGISGIPVFQISRYAAKALREKREVKAQIDFVPSLSLAELQRELWERRTKWEKRTAEELLNSLFPSKLIPVLLKEAGIGKAMWAGRISRPEWDAFACMCKAFEVHIRETNPFGSAQVCAGGIRTEEVSSTTLESRLTEGLYITGELLDVDGICGGYNLHFAWATGALAGKYAAQ